jgi:hypothetical protein
MKSAKEWAAEVVRRSDYPSVGEYHVSIEIDGAYITSEGQGSTTDGERAERVARGIIERLVERVQADARAPLESETARLKEELAETKKELDETEQALRAEYE